MLRLVDCSLLTPPRPGPDGRSRYRMLETLRAYGNRLLAQAAEQDQAAAALAMWALRVAEQAAAGLLASTAEELAAARSWTPRRPPCGRSWPGRWSVIRRPRRGWRTRWAGGGCCGAAAGPVRGAVRGGRARRGGQRRLVRRPAADHLAAVFSADQAGALEPATALRDVAAGPGPSRALADGLFGRAVALGNLDRACEAAEEARRSLAVAREIGYPTGETGPSALTLAARSRDDMDHAVQLARQAAQITACVPGVCVRRRAAPRPAVFLTAGDLACALMLSARRGLARSRHAGAEGLRVEPAASDGVPGRGRGPRRARRGALARRAPDLRADRRLVRAEPLPG